MSAKNRKELQYLIKCVGQKGKASYDLVYKSNVLFNPEVPKLEVGMMVEFRYQKSEKSKVEIWKGEILAESGKNFAEKNTKYKQCLIWNVKILYSRRRRTARLKRWLYG